MTRHAALIPLASRGDGGGELLELYCETSSDTGKDEQDRKRGIEPSVEALRPINLHGSGQRAMAAVQKLLNAKAKRRFELDTRKVRYSNKPMSSLVEGRSAELGIALSILLSGSQNTVRSVIATGVLEVLPGILDFNARVEQVESLDEKLTLIAEAKQKGLLPREIDKVLVPRPNRAAEQAGAVLPLAERDAVKTLKRLGIEVIPVRTLRDAAKQVNISLTDRLSVVRRTLAAAGVAAMVGLAGWGWLWTRDVPVIFDAGPTEELGGKPFLVCADPGGRYAVYRPIPTEGLVPQVPLTGVLGWRIRLGSFKSTDAAIFEALNGSVGVGSYRVVVAFVGERSGLHILPTEGGALQVLKQPGVRWDWGQQVDKPAEAGVLVFLVRRFGGFDLEQVQEKFNARFDRKGDDAPINLEFASNFLAEQASGSLRYFFETVEGPAPCDVAATARRPAS